MMGTSDRVSTRTDVIIEYVGSTRLHPGVGGLNVSEVMARGVPSLCGLCSEICRERVFCGKRAEARDGAGYSGELRDDDRCAVCAFDLDDFHAGQSADVLPFVRAVADD